MMKNYTILLLCLLFSTSLYGQAKYDNIWLLNVSQSRKSIILDWGKKSPPDTSTLQIRSEIIIGNPNASICDKNGKFKYYSNGCAIAGSDYKMLPNGKQINPGWVHQAYCGEYSDDFYPSSNNIVFLPCPSDSNKYFLFHLARGDFDLATLELPLYSFYYSEIDAKQGKMGVVTKKNVLLTHDTLSSIGVNACKHANELDWWVIVPSIFTQSFHRALLTKDSVIYVGKQKVAEKNGYSPKDWSGQSVFSPDGRKYVRTDPHNGTRIYNFDRCTGLLSNPIFIDTLGSYYSYSGVGISPNSRFLYVTHFDVLYQFDLEAKNIPKSKIKIAERDNFVNYRGDQINFRKCQLAPDNKIYVGSAGIMDWLSIIHKPDEQGLACDFRQHDFKLPKLYEGLPNHPHYRMPKLEGVDCSQKANQNSFVIYPNPSTGHVFVKAVDAPATGFTWRLYDELGRYVFSYVLENIISEFELPPHLPQGIYFWRVLDGVKPLQSGKLVLIE